MSCTCWAVLLAGGDGKRLSRLTRSIYGQERPKQFCRLLQNKTLLGQTRERIAPLIGPAKTCFIVVESHSRYYETELADVPPARIFIQPANRGTTAAIIYSLLRIMRIEPGATVAFFPTDHYCVNTAAFCAAIERAESVASQNQDSVALLGAIPEDSDPEYGWIEPGKCVGGDEGPSIFRVSRFREKPTPDLAVELRNGGCLLNTFVMVGKAQAFMGLLESAVPYLVRTFAPLAQKHFREMGMLRRIYQNLPTGDFSHQVLAACADRLLVIRLAENAGWSDLGTEERVRTVASQSGAGPQNLEAFRTWLAAYRKRLDEVCHRSSSAGSGIAG